MAITDPHGRAFIPSMLEDDVLRLLAPASKVDGGQNWLMPIVYDFSRKAGLNPDDPAQALPEPASWNTVAAVDDWPIGRLPAVLVIAGGSTEDPERYPDGYYMEWVGLEIAIVDSANTPWAASKNAGIYAMAARAAVVQHLPDLPDPVARVQDVRAGQFDPRPLGLRDTERKDTVAAGLVSCLCLIADSLTDTVEITTPPDPPSTPTPDRPTVQTVDVDITTE